MIFDPAIFGASKNAFSGTASKGETVTLGFKPSLVILLNTNPSSSSSSQQGTIIFSSSNHTISANYISGTTGISYQSISLITSTGFYVPEYSSSAAKTGYDSYTSKVRTAYSVTGDFDYIAFK